VSRLPASLGYEVTNETINTLLAQAAGKVDSLDGLALEQLAREEQERLTAWLDERDADAAEERAAGEESDRAAEYEAERSLEETCP